MNKFWKEELGSFKKELINNEDQGELNYDKQEKLSDYGEEHNDNTKLHTGIQFISHLTLEKLPVSNSDQEPHKLFIGKTRQSFQLANVKKVLLVSKTNLDTTLLQIDPKYQDCKASVDFLKKAEIIFQKNCQYTDPHLCQEERKNLAFHMEKVLNNFVSFDFYSNFYQKIRKI